jgi:halogenation protein CepH
MDAPDVVIAGAGPAGASAAIALAELGHRVVLLDRARFPRHRIGESLPPKVDTLFALLGVSRRIEQAGFVRMAGTTVHQGDHTISHEFDPERGALGYQVDRARFDQLLLDRARETGAEVIEEAHVLDVERGSDGRAVGVQVRHTDGGHESIEVIPGSFFVDATGTSGVLSRALGLRRKESVRTLAISGYFAKSRTPDSFPAPNTLFEMTRTGWIWSVLLADGRRNVTIGVDLGELKSSGKAIDAVYQDRLEESLLVGPLVRGEEPSSPIAAHDATGYTSERYVECGCLLAGDAASFIDPLTSQGVYKAIHSGIHGAAVINTILRRPADAETAIAYYDELQRLAHERYTEVAVGFYRASPFADEPFWQVRSRSELFLEAFSLEEARSRGDRRARFVDLMRKEGGRSLRVAKTAAFTVALRPTIEAGFVVRAPAVVKGRELVLSSDRLNVELLASLIDGRLVADVFEGYLAASSEPRSQETARALTRALGRLYERELITVDHSSRLP